MGELAISGGGGVCKGRVNERQYGRELGGRKAVRGEVSIRENVEERKIGNRQDDREVRGTEDTKDRIARI